MKSLTKPVKFASFLDSTRSNWFDTSALYSEDSVKTPKVNVEEKNGVIVVFAEMPGVDENDLNVSVENNILSIKSENENENKESEKSRYYKEFSHGKFERKFSLPENVDEKKITAKYKNGILEISIPRIIKKDTVKKIKVVSE